MSHHLCGQGSGDNNTFSFQDFIDGIVDFCSDVYQAMLTEADSISQEQEAIPITPYWDAINGFYDGSVPSHLSHAHGTEGLDSSLTVAPFGSNFDMNDFFGASLNIKTDNFRFFLNYTSVGAGGIGPDGHPGGNAFQTPGYWSDQGRLGEVWTPGHTSYEGRSDGMFIGLEVRF